MPNNNYISRSKFQEVFAKALSKCNVPQDEQDKFFEEGSTLQLRNLGICIAITNIIDNIIKEELPDYDGCVCIFVYRLSDHVCFFGKGITSGHVKLFLFYFDDLLVDLVRLYFYIFCQI